MHVHFHTFLSHNRFNDIAPRLKNEEPYSISSGEMIRN